MLDTNGNGKRDEYVEPNQPVDPAKDKRIAGGFYAVMPSPTDGSIWGTVGVFGGKGAVVRDRAETVHTALESPDHLLVVAAGGPAGGFGAVIPPWFGGKTRAVTAAIGACVDCERS